MANEDLQTKSDKALENIIRYQAGQILKNQARLDAAKTILQQRAKEAQKEVK